MYTVIYYLTKDQSITKAARIWSNTQNGCICKIFLNPFKCIYSIYINIYIMHVKNCILIYVLKFNFSLINVI